MASDVLEAESTLEKNKRAKDAEQGRGDGNFE